MPRNLYAEDRIVDQEDALRHAERLQLLKSIVRELELFDHPNWSVFEGRLREIEDRGMEQLLICPEEEVRAARARVKLARDLLGLRDELDAKAAELRLELFGPTEEE